MDRDDPITQFFPGQEDVDLYNVMSLTSEATPDEIKKAYRRLALIYHPDKHMHAGEDARKEASIKFQQLGFAYAILSDDKKKQRYDSTGSTDEGFDLGAGEAGWDTYFEELFEKVTKGRLDESKKEYQGSTEEIVDVKAAYLETQGSIENILAHIPHSNHTDEDRFVKIINEAIKEGALPSFPLWQQGITDVKAKSRRRKEGEKEAAEAEATAKELGVWDEFYGNKPPGKRKQTRGSGNTRNGNSTEQANGEEDLSALKALIQSKKKNAEGFLDSLASKYADTGKSKSRGSGRNKRSSVAEGQGGSLKKKAKTAEPPDIGEEEFQKLQERLFGEKKAETGNRGKAKASRSG